MKFEVYQLKIVGVLPLNKWRWRLIGRNGKPVARCIKSYANKSKCLDGVLSSMSTDQKTQIVHIDK